MRNIRRKINTMKTTLKLFTLTLALAVLCFGQTALSTTTLGAAITDTNGTTITLTSTSTMQNAGPANRVNTCFYVDKELFGVTTVIDSTHVLVATRGSSCGAVGAAARPTFHASGAKVYFANTSSSGNFVTPAAMLIGKNYQPTAELWGSCTSTSELSLPRIYLYSGDIFDCKSSGQWIYVGNGTMGAAGNRLSAFCTGALGSSQTNYANFAACSGATAATARLVVTGNGTLANFYVSASAAVSGGSGVDVATVYKNGSATTITCTFATGGAATTCSDTTHSVAVVAGDVIQFALATASGDTGSNLGFSVGVY